MLAKTLRHRRLLLLVTGVVLGAAAWRLAASELLSLGDVQTAGAVRVAVLLGANPSHRGVVTGAPLLVSAINGWSEDATLELIRCGADVNASTPYGRTALSEAVLWDKYDLVVCLLRAGADPNRRDSRGRTALFAAAGGSDFGSRNPQVAAALLEAGADPRVRDANGGSALGEAAAFGRTEIARLLLARGADPNASDVYNWTPLMSAAWAGDADCAGLLLSAGADPGTREKRGRSAETIAQSAGARDVVVMLKKAAPKVRQGNSGHRAAP